MTRGRARPPRKSSDPTRRLTILSSGDRGELEALQLEIRRLARAQGLDVIDVRIARDERRPARRSR